MLNSLQELFEIDLWWGPVAMCRFPSHRGSVGLRAGVSKVETMLARIGVGQFWFARKGQP